MKLSATGVFLASTLIAFLLIEEVTSRGGGGGGRGGGGGGRGGYYGSPSSGGGGKSGVSGKTVAKGLVVAGAAGGAAAFLASRKGSSRDEDAGTGNANSNVRVVQGNGINLPLFLPPQESRSYYRREGPSMSAFGIIALILSLLGVGALIWFCHTVGLPMWRERNRKHALLDEPLRSPLDEKMSLQETASTVSPSP